MKKLEVRLCRDRGDRVVGVLTEDRGRSSFEYAPSFLASGCSLSPFRISFTPGIHEHRNRAFGPLPGLFDDSLPDHWGRLLMDRRFGVADRSRQPASSLDRLAFLGSRTMGALTYHPSDEWPPSDEGDFSLQELARQSRAVLCDESTTVPRELLRSGCPPGGARPKVLVGFDPLTGDLRSGEDDLPGTHEPWIVKFALKNDGDHAGALEFVYAQMAREAGLAIPPTRLFDTARGERFFGIMRFDRRGRRRIPVHTFGGLIEANLRTPSSDYVDLLKVTRLLTRDHRDVLEAFRRMAFNVFAHNRDDHVKNFSFLLDDETGQWSLAPAYDLNFSEGPCGEHALTVAGEGRNPTIRHMLEVGASSGIPEKAALAIIDQVRGAITRFDSLADAAGIPPRRRPSLQVSE